MIFSKVEFWLQSDSNPCFSNRRFGLIVGIESIRTIEQGEEVFANYGYRLKSGPPWYQKAFLDFMLDQPDDREITGRRYNAGL
jgi:hypothetical protein